MFASLPVSSFNGTVHSSNDRFILHCEFLVIIAVHTCLTVEKKWIVVVAFMLFSGGGVA